MPENVAPRSGAPAAGPGSRGKGAYQDRDKPAQIRFSNISAAKGIAPFVRARAHCDFGRGCGVRSVPCGLFRPGDRLFVPSAPARERGGLWTRPVVGLGAP